MKLERLQLPLERGQVPGRGLFAAQNGTQFLEFCGTVSMEVAEARSKTQTFNGRETSSIRDLTATRATLVRFSGISCGSLIWMPVIQLLL